MDRRHFIGSALAALAAGCDRRGHLEGDALGPNLKLGHRLRSLDFPPPSSERTARVVIAGGGIAGLSAAWWLKRAGLDDFVLLETEPEPGGNARGGRSPATRFPWGAHYLPLPSREASELMLLLADLGFMTGRNARGEPVYDERYVVFPTRERLFIEGEWRPGLSAFSSARSRSQLARFEERMREFRDAKGADGRDAFASPSALSSTDPHFRALDSISMAQWLEREGFDDPALLWYVNYACRDDFGSIAADTSAWAGIHYHAGRKPPGGYAHDAVLTAPEGNAFLAEAMTRRVARQVEAGQMVWRVEPGRSSVEVLSSDGVRSVRWRARQAIIALPQFAVPYILAGAERRNFEYAPWLVANVSVRALPGGRGAEPAWDNVIYDSASLGYVVATHQQLRQHTGSSVLTWYLPLTARPAAAARTQLLETPWRDWAGVVLADLRRAHPDIDDLATRIDIWRWGHGMVKPVPGTIAAAAALPRSLRNIHFAHSDLSGMSLFEEAHYWGVQAAKRALAQLA